MGRQLELESFLSKYIYDLQGLRITDCIEFLEMEINLKNSFRYISFYKPVPNTIRIVNVDYPFKTIYDVRIPLCLHLIKFL